MTKKQIVLAGALIGLGPVFERTARLMELKSFADDAIAWGKKVVGGTPAPRDGHKADNTGGDRIE